MAAASSAKRALHIEVVSDIVCPWCYVGKKKLTEAVALAKGKHKELDISIGYNPYQLDSAMGHGLDKEEVYRNKFGDRAEQMHQRVADVGKEVGIAFSFEGKMSNTLDAHRLVDYAKLHGGSYAEEKAVESLFHRYFEESQDIGDTQVLLSVADDAGLDREKAKQYLDSDEGIDTVKQKIKQVQRLGVTGVPFYIINDRYGVSGAETPETFLAAFEKVLACQE
ncbi:DSBA oxidoreductase [Martensiomyces pterosporus]|nr:DSBA oxidoreductase [Martensiomyces pterosporus]